MPKTRLEQERFAYFYKDSTSGVYNRDYLEFTLSQHISSQQNNDQQNNEPYAFKCIYAIYLHNFSLYNNINGWNQGDKLLRKVANKLQDLCPDGLVFRIFGDDFLVMHEEHQKLEDKKVKSLKDALKDTCVDISFKDINLQKNEINSIEKLEKFL